MKLNLIWNILNMSHIQTMLLFRVYVEVKSNYLGPE